MNGFEKNDKLDQTSFNSNMEVQPHNFYTSDLLSLEKDQKYYEQA